MGPYPVQKFSVGDLVKRKGKEWYALILDIKESNGYFYPEFMWIETGEIESCSFSLLEVVS